ncbi:hypothetical protein Mapa_001517 [Marchantia paleacea]|nr:hypothetical protein Mapa_001517 [Marchantia paleacea]
MILYKTVLQLSSKIKVLFLDTEVQITKKTDVIDRKKEGQTKEDPPCPTLLTMSWDWIANMTITCTAIPAEPKA